MFQRVLKVPKNRSFFLFGARGTGKSTLLRRHFPAPSSHTINLLDLGEEARLSRDPQALEREVLALEPTVTHVVLDEIQKVPRLLDVVHNLIETYRVPQSFVLTGSSARKLKAGGANLLAGRAALRHLFPLLPSELGEVFDLAGYLRWGGLPKIWNTDSEEERRDFLVAYGQTYLKEEIWSEQFVRQLDPFRRFLEVAARTSGKILNYSNVARDSGVDVKTVQSWYALLEDTLVGFHVDAFHTSLRKRLRAAPKFYLFDPGVSRALAHMLNVTPQESTSYFGDLFEQFVVSQIVAANDYQQRDFRLNYLMTKAGVEVDLVVERPGLPLALVEIKSTTQVREEDYRNLVHFSADFPDATLMLLSRDPRPQRLGRVVALPWERGIEELMQGH